MTTHHMTLADRAAFEERVGALGLETPVAVALTDLDGFGPLNDRYGRSGGDSILRNWERTLTGSLPADAIVARLGGDEFAVAFPGATAESALVVLDEIRQHVAARPASDEVPEHLGVSVGIAARPPHATEPADLLKAAESALYRAKREGAARVAIYVEEKMTLKSNYYAKASLARLAKLSDATGRTEASLLREALDDLFEKYRDEL
jgi:diguanylate cyclase